MAPYGTYHMPVFYRAAFWIGLCLAGGVGTAAANVLIQKSGRKPLSWQRVLLQSLGATLLVWLCFLGLTLVLQGPPEPSFYYLTPFYIWIIGVVICSFGELMRKRDLGKSAQAENVRPAIFDRLKPALRRAELYALSSEDHYVRVHTSAGDALILMRLSDAIKETAPAPGQQTHRSWWVAEAGIKEVNKSDGKLSVTLRNEASVPVSRERSKSLREAGWV